MYEKLHDKNNGILDFFKIFDLNYFEMSSGKANVGRSLKANNVMSYFNFFNVKFKGFQKIFSFLSPSEQDREKVKMLMTPYHKSLNKDNTKLSTLLKIKLPEIYYL